MASTNKRRRWLFLPEIAVLLVSTVVCLILAEATLRIIVPFETTNRSNLRIPHPVFGWSLAPNGYGIHEVDGKIIQLRHNSEGWQDIEHTVINHEGNLRIAVLGDSFMQAYSVTLEDSFTSVIKQIGKDAGYQLETFNFGVGGYGTLQEYLVFKNVAVRYQPDIVLLAFYLENDLKNNSPGLKQAVYSKWAGTRPFLIPDFLPDWDLSPVDYEGALKRFERHDTERIPFLGDWQKRSALIKLSNDLLDVIYKNYWTDIPGKRKNTKPSINKKEKSKTISNTLNGSGECIKTQSDNDEAWLITKHILQRLDKEVDEAGADLYVFSVPGKREIDRILLNSNISDADSTAMGCLENPVAYQKLSALLENLGIEYINLLPEFLSVAKMQGNNLFGISDGHWNAIGHRLASEKVFEQLELRDAFQENE